MKRVNNSTIYHKNCEKKERYTRNAAQKNEVKKQRRMIWIPQNGFALKPHSKQWHKTNNLYRFERRPKKLPRNFFSGDWYIGDFSPNFYFYSSAITSSLLYLLMQTLFWFRQSFFIAPIVFQWHKQWIDIKMNYNLPKM